MSDDEEESRLGEGPPEAGDLSDGEQGVKSLHPGDLTPRRMAQSERRQLRGRFPVEAGCLPVVAALEEKLYPRPIPPGAKRADKVLAHVQRDMLGLLGALAHVEEGEVDAVGAAFDWALHLFADIELQRRLLILAEVAPRKAALSDPDRVKPLFSDAEIREMEEEAAPAQRQQRQPRGRFFRGGQQRGPPPREKSAEWRGNRSEASRGRFRGRGGRRQ